MDMMLCPSMMCADYGNLAGEIKSLEAAGTDVFHIDIMDGAFVPNFGMGLQDTEYICRHAAKPVDVHLMIMEPYRHVDRFIELGAQIIYVHPEGDLHPTRTLGRIRDAGRVPAIAINPGTSVESILPLLDYADYVLVMTVNPGFAGQKYLGPVDRKIDRLVSLKEEYGFEVVIDGACSPEVIGRLHAKGVKGFVLGTSALFGKPGGYGALMQGLRDLAK